MKTHNLTVRISEEQKAQLEKVAEKEGVSTSEYVRRLLRESLNKEIDTAESVNMERLKKLDQSRRAQDILDLGLSGLESKFMTALGYIFSVDTGDPIHKIIKTTLEHQRDLGLTSITLDSMSREERENAFRSLYPFFNSNLAKRPSDAAYLVAESIFITYLSFVYPSPIFMTTPFSLEIMNRLTGLNEELEYARDLIKNAEKKKK